MAKNKKGFSEVVATVLVIFLTIAAIAVLITFIIPFIKEKLTKGSECLDYKGYFQFEEKFVTSDGIKKYNCYSLKTGPPSNLYIGASIRANPAEKDAIDEVAGLKLVFIGEGKSKDVDINSGDPPTSKLWMYGESRANLEIPSNGEVITYIYNEPASTAKYLSAEVYPVLESERICDVSDRIDLESCYLIDLSAT